ncbi:MAG: hypothetical protein WAO00_13495 [Chthoniobacterales bacterium]
MNRSFSAFCILSLVAASFAATVRGEIDFTPTVNRYMSEGAEYANASFKDGKRSVSIAVPRTWACRGDASRLQFTPPEPSLAEGTIQSLPAKGLIRFDEPTVQAFGQQVVSTVPSGSQGVTVVSQLENPVIIDGNLSYEFVVSFQTLGKTFLRSVVLVACPDQQLIFRFTAPKADFDNLNRSFRQSIYSWQWTEQSPVAPKQDPAMASAPAPQAPSTAN